MNSIKHHPNADIIQRNISLHPVFIHENLIISRSIVTDIDLSKGLL